MLLNLTRSQLVYLVNLLSSVIVLMVLSMMILGDSVFAKTLKQLAKLIVQFVALTLSAFPKITGLTYVFVIMDLLEMESNV